jgi:hypothetical protein
MNAAAFRLLYAYHFSENRKLWDQGIMALTQEQFTRDVNFAALLAAFLAGEGDNERFR